MTKRPLTKADIEEAKRIFEKGIADDLARTSDSTLEYRNARKRLQSALKCVMKVKPE